jgi:hypothetical protein
MWAGLTKLVAQKADARLGNMSPRLFALGALADSSISGLRDVTAGQNDFNGVVGFPAVNGYDQATGWGSPDMTVFAFAYLALTATPAKSPVTFTPKTMTFARRKLASVSNARLVTLTNPSRNKSALIIDSLELSTGNFALDSASTTCSEGESMPPGSHCHIGIRFTPTVRGRVSATLTIVDNSSSSPHIVSIFGTGL